MPIYEYRCNSCRRRSSLLVRSFNGPEQIACQYCGNEGATRVFSTFAIVRSEERRMEDLEDRARYGELDENDPRSVARFMRQMEREVGEEMGPEFDEMVERLEAGENPEDLAPPDGTGGMDSFGLDDDLGF
jgi:putative FmdB family regulatory protein